MVNRLARSLTQPSVGELFVLLFRTCGRPSALRGVPGTSTHVYDMGASSFLPFFNEPAP